MNSIERVKAAIHFKGPDRVPVWKAGLSDVMYLFPLPPKSWNPGYAENEQGLFPFMGGDDFLKLRFWTWDRPDWARDPKYKNFLKIEREEVDEFGVIWNRDDSNASMGHPGRASLLDWDNYDEYVTQYNPDPYDPSRYAKFKTIAKLFARKRYRMAILGFQGPYTTASAMRGFENFMMDHALYPEKTKKLLEFLTNFYVEQAKAWFKYGTDPHGFIIYDDLADQTRPFMSPDMFREFYEPVFKRIFDEAHKLGAEVHLHSCGKIDTLIPTLLEWGVDSLELDSPRMTGYPDLDQFRGEVMMWGCVNIQSVYTQGTSEECEREVWHMVRNLGTERGGFGAYVYPQPGHIMVPRANVKAFDQGLKKYGVYDNIPAGWWKAPLPEAWDDNQVPPLPK
jgi:uroporphyrinogen decarboxylase